MFIKRFFLPSLPLLLSASLLVAAAADPDAPISDAVDSPAIFSDVAGSAFEPFILAAAASGIVHGYPDGTYRPEAVVSFAEALKISTRANGLADWTDAADASWPTPYRDLYDRAYSLPGISMPADDTPASRGLAVALAVSYLGVDLSTIDTSLLPAGFSDTHPASNILDAYAVFAREAGIIDGYPDGTFHADYSVTRGAFAKISANAVTAKSRALEIFSDLRARSACTSLASRSVHGVRMTVVTVRLSATCRVVASLSGSGETLDSLARRVWGSAAINGAYFCPADYPECHGANASFSTRIEDGKNVSAYGDDTGKYGTVFAFDFSGKPFLVQKWYDYSSGRSDVLLPDRRLNAERFPEIHSGISNFPLLLADGHDRVSDSEAVIDAKMRAKWNRNFICSNRGGSVVLFVSAENLTIYEVPALARELGCRDALNLDSGGSTALMHEGYYVRGPGRNIMDAFVAVDDATR